MTTTTLGRLMASAIACTALTAAAWPSIHPLRAA